MKQILCVSYDTVTGQQRSAIQQYANVADAKRSWGCAIAQIEQSKNPDNIPIQDLQLYQLAEIDTETLEITPIPMSDRFVCKAQEFMKGE